MGLTPSGRILPPWGARRVGPLHMRPDQCLHPATVPLHSSPSFRMPPGGPRRLAIRALPPLPPLGVRLPCVPLRPLSLNLHLLRNCCGRGRGGSKRVSQVSGSQVPSNWGRGGVSHRELNPRNPRPGGQWEETGRQRCLPIPSICMGAAPRPCYSGWY